MRNRKQFYSFYRQLAILQKAGFTLLRSLELLMHNAASRAIGSTARRLIESIEKGGSFWEALKQDPDHFPELEVQLIRAGEESGKLPNVLERLAATRMQEIAFRDRLKAVAAYPCFVGVIAVGLIVFLSKVVLPALVNPFQEYHIKLPTAARLIVRMTNTVSQHWFVLGLGLVVAVLLVRFILATPRVRYCWDSLKLRYAFFGPLAKEHVVVHTCSTLAMLLESGVNLLRALELVRDGATNRVVSRTLNEMREEVTAGHSMTSPLRKRTVFPSMVVDMIVTGEQTGSLPENLQHANEIYQEELQTKLQLLENMTEPALLLVAGLIVMLAVFSFFFTYIHLINVVATRS